MNLMLWLSFLCEDDCVFKQEHAAMVFGVFHQHKFTLTQDLAVLTHVTLHKHMYMHG